MHTKGGGCPPFEKIMGGGVIPPVRPKWGRGYPPTPLPPPAVSGTHAPSRTPREIQDCGAGTGGGVPPPSRTQGEGGDPLLEKIVGGGWPHPGKR